MKQFLKMTTMIIGGLVVLAIVLPWVITLNQYKTLIQQKAFEATGRDVEVTGDVRFGILPSPYARLTDVVVKNPDGAMSKEFASIKAIDIGVALVPLIERKVQVTHITITAPAITMETMANGQNNWQFTPQQNTATTATPDEEDASEESHFSIDDFTIEKGYIRTVDVQKKSQQTIGPIDGTFKITSLKGPISGKGSVTVLDKLPIKFETVIELIPSNPNGVIPFKMGLNLPDNIARADLTGQIQKGDNLSAKIETAVAINDLPKILATISNDNTAPSLPVYLQGKTVLNGQINYADKQAKIENMTITAGGLEVSGSLLADLQDKTSITLDLTNVVIPPELAQQSTSNSTVPNESETTLAQTMQNSFTSAARLLDTDLPKSPLDIVVTANQLPLPGQPTMRDLRIAASITPNGVTIQDIETKLPGNSFLQLQGELPARSDGKIDHMTMNAKFNTQNLQTAMGKGDSASGTPTNLQATINLTRDQLQLAPLQISQNSQTVQGDITYSPKASDALIVALKGSSLDLDSFLGKQDEAKTTLAAASPQPTTSEKPSDPLAILQGLKAKISANLDNVIFKQKTAKQVTVEANISDSGLQLQSARIGDLGGMIVTAQGKVDHLSPLSGAALTAQATTPNLSQTLQTLGNAAAENLGASKFDAQIDGDANNLKVALNGTIDQGNIAVNGTAKDLNASPSFTGTINISHPETATIVRNFGGMKPTVNLGAFAFKTDLTYGSDTIKADNILVKLGSAGTLQGHVNVIPDKGTRKIDADLKGDKLALAALMGDDTTTNDKAVNTAQPKQTDEGWSKDPVNLSGLRNLNGNANVEIGELLYKKFIIKNFKTTLAFANNQMNVSVFKGNLFDAGDFSVTGQLTPGAENQANKGDFAITLDKADAQKLFVALGSKPFNKGTIDLNQKISFNGASPYAIVNSLNGDGQAKITGAVINGIDLDSLAAKMVRPNSLSDVVGILDQARAGGETAISDTTIPVTIRNGVVQIQNTEVTTQKSKMALGGTANLPSKIVDLTGQISFTELKNLPAVTMLVKGPMSAPQKSFDTRSFASYYAQKAVGKLQDKIGKFLGTSGDTPASTPAPAGSGVTAPTPPVAPTSSATPAPADATQKSKNDAIKQLGNQMLNNLFNNK
jgi:hypothetical protein